jgi:hypothetical protein
MLFTTWRVHGSSKKERGTKKRKRWMRGQGGCPSFGGETFWPPPPIPVPSATAA